MYGKSQKFASLLGILVVLTLLVASCGPTPTPEVIEKVVKETVVVEKEVEVTKVVEKEVVVTATPEPEEKAGPVEGGWLTVAFLSTIQDTGDLHIATSSHSRFLAGHALDTLIRKNPADGTYHPGLAESWEIADDGLSVTLHLRKGVKFHDGTPFNAEAVKFNLDRIATLDKAKGKTAYVTLSAGDLYDKCEVIDDYTVKISFKKPYALMIGALSTNEVGAIHSPTAIEKYGDEYGTEAIVGTGPFKFVEWTGPLGEIRFERNEDYNWASPIYNHQGPPYLDGFTFKGIVEPGTRTSALEAGSVDVSYVLEKDVALFKDRPGFKTLLVPKQGTARFYNMNLESPILKDIRVRQAIAHTIDREGIINSAQFGGVGKVALSFISQATWGQSTEEFREYNYLYDLDKAKALLEEVGWKDEDGDGVREAHGVEGIADGTELRLLEAVNANALGESEILQGLVTDAGIKVELQVVDFATMWGYLRAGEYDVNLNSTSGSHNWLIVPFFHSKGIEAQTNVVRYSNPEVDKLIDQVDVTLDPAKQRELWAQIQKIVLKDVPVVPMWDIIYCWTMKEGVEDLTVDSAAIGLYLYDAWINPNP